MSKNNNLKKEIEEDIKRRESEIKNEMSQFEKKFKYEFPNDVRNAIKRLTNIKDKGEQEILRKVVKLIREDNNQALKEFPISRAVINTIYELRVTMVFEIYSITDIIRYTTNLLGLEHDVRIQNILEKLIYIKVCNEQKFKFFNEILEKNENNLCLSDSNIYIDDFEKILYIIDNEVLEFQNLIFSIQNEVGKELVIEYVEKIPKLTENIHLKYKCICNYLN